MVQPRIRWWRVDLGEDEVRAVSDAILARRITMGAISERFEARVGELLGVRHCVLVNSGASGLLASLIASQVGPGDEVIVPALTFLATANAVKVLGARVRLVDVQADRPLLDVDRLAGLIGPSTRVVIPVHLNGRAADVGRTLEVARGHGLRVVEDAAQAFWSCHQQKFLGTESDFGVFSFGVTKLVSTGEGGAVVTADAALARAIRLIRNHGALSLADGRFETPGLNLRPLDLLSALGLCALDRLSDRAQRLRAVYRRYESGLQDLRSIRILPVDLASGELPLWVEALASDRDAVIRALRRRGIEARPFPPALCDVPGVGDSTPMRCARFFARHGLVLPSGPDRTEEEIAQVIAALHEADGRNARPMPSRPRRRETTSVVCATARIRSLHDATAFRRDDSGRSPAFFRIGPTCEVDASTIQELVSVARSCGGVARICLHDGPDAAVQDMVIAKTAATSVPARHRVHSQTFHAVHGRLAVFLFEDDGRLRRAVVLDDFLPIVRVPPGVYYLDLPLDEAVVYREVLAGPFDPDEREAAPWWPDREDGRARRIRELHARVRTPPRQ